MVRKRERFLLGFDRDGQCVYGEDRDGRSRFVDAMTLGEARSRVKDFRPPGAVVAIYRLEKVEEHTTT